MQGNVNLSNQVFSPRRSENADRQLEQREASRTTRAEHDQIVVAIRHLEAALASPAPTREEPWARRASSELRQVRSALEAHVLSAESPGGLFDELALVSTGAATRVLDLRAEHSHLLAAAQRLDQHLNSHGQTVDFQSLRGEAAALLTALKQHNANEVDLILETFWTDIGVGD